VSAVREVCTLSLRTRYRGEVAFTVCCLPRPREQRVYLLASRDVMGSRGVSFAAPRRASSGEIISSAAFLACCLAREEESEDHRFLAAVGADGPAARSDGDIR
jgi:hypothetical protein